MKRKQTVAIVSTSALAAGMAHGAVLYTKQNVVLPCNGNTAPNTAAPFDISGDTIYDFFLSFDGLGPANPQKPYVSGYLTGSPPNSAVMGLTYTNVGAYGPFQDGAPVATFGTMIDASFLTPIVTNYGKVYLYQDGNANTVGNWGLSASTEGYLGVELFDASSSITNFGWLHLIWDPTANPRTLTCVDSGYETTPGVGIVAGATNTVGAPIIYSEPASQTVGAGAYVQFQVAALAAPPPAYQWKARGIGGGVYTNVTNAGVVSGSTTSNLTINGASAANMLDYIVVITNSLGATTSSPPARLTVVQPAVTPSPQVLFGGLTAQFNVSVAGGLTPTYRWRKSGANLSDTGRIIGSTTAQLQVSNLQTTDAANYDVVLTMGSLVVTSTVSSLTVLPIDGESTYQMALLAAGPWAYYPLNETGDPSTNNLLAYDNAKAYNGVYGTNVANAFSGVAGPRAGDGFPGFAPNNAAANFHNDPANPDGYCRIPLAPWNLNTDTATMLAWVNPSDSQLALSTVLFSGNVSSMSAGIQYYYQLNSSTSARDVGYVWEDVTSSSYFFDSQLCPPVGQWSMVAAVITPRAGTVYLFNTNGVSSATNDGTTVFAPFNPFTNQVMAFATPEYIGTDPGDPTGGRNFLGTIDEVAVFKKALSQDQLQTIFNGALGIAPPPPTNVTLQLTRAGASLQLSWPQGTLLEATSLSGPWITNLLAVPPAYTVNPTNRSKFYRVLLR